MILFSFALLLFSFFVLLSYGQKLETNQTQVQGEEKDLFVFLGPELHDSLIHLASKAVTNSLVPYVDLVLTG